MKILFNLYALESSKPEITLDLPFIPMPGDYFGLSDKDLEIWQDYLDSNGFDDINLEDCQWVIRRIFNNSGKSITIMLGSLDEYATYLKESSGYLEL
jgi:hypothetical protein